MPSLLSIFLLATTSVVYAAQNDTDPAHDPNNPLKYIPNNLLTGIAFGIMMLIFVFQSLFMWKQGGRYMLPMVIGELAYGIGFLFRFGLHSNPDSRGLFIGEYLLIVLAPCGFIAALYAILGRLAGMLQCPQFLWIRPSRITMVFVISDVITFLIQATGGAISVGNDPSKIKLGSNIFLLGLALQLASFLFFCVVFSRFILGIRKHEPLVWRRDSGRSLVNDWRILALALTISCVGITIRTIYRIIEGAQHNQGKLSTVEVYFYILDTLPLLITTGLYVPFWPGRFIVERKDVEAVRLESR